MGNRNPACKFKPSAEGQGVQNRPNCKPTPVSVRDSYGAEEEHIVVSSILWGLVSLAPCYQQARGHASGECPVHRSAARMGAQTCLEGDTVCRHRRALNGGWADETFCPLKFRLPLLKA